MKIKLSIILCLFISYGTCFAQETNLDVKLFRLKGLEFDSKKETIIGKFGKPQKVFEPNYECGFHSEAEQGNKYYIMSYEYVAFIGNDTEKYGIKSIDFNPKSNLTLDYGKYKFNHKLTKADFIKMFGNSTIGKFNDRGNGVTDVLIFFKDADDGLSFSFKSGCLIKISYWSPC
jgi:hypothetical protein